MTGTDKDPFERLSHTATPEPDPTRIAAVAAMSARAFSADLARASGQQGRMSRFAHWLKGTHWLMPASATAVTVLVAALLVPLIMQPQPGAPAPADTMLSRAPAAVADAGPSATQEREQGTRLGAVPPPAAMAESAPLDLRADIAVETYSFDGLDIVVRSAPEDVSLYELDGAVERQIDRRAKTPSETIILTDAFRHHTDASLLLIRSGAEGGQQQWDAFVEGAGGYVLSGALSTQIHDAADRAEVIARLEGAER